MKRYIKIPIPNISEKKGGKIKYKTLCYYQVII